MEMAKVAAAGLIACVCCLLLEAKNKEYALFTALAFGAIVLALAIDCVAPVVGTLRLYAEGAGLNNSHILIILRIIAIAYIAGFAAELCRDGGRSAIAGKIELFARAVICAYSLPIVVSLFELCCSLL